MAFRDLAKSVIATLDDVMGEDASYEQWRAATQDYASALFVRVRPIAREQLISGYSGNQITGETLFRVAVNAVPVPANKSRITHDGKTWAITSFDRIDPLGLDWVFGCRRI
jgi:hypothetical protein